jgi:hypothetical protein
LLPHRQTLMNYFEAALIVLKGSQRPMTAQEIIDEAVAKGLITPWGKTPEATLSAQLYVYVRDNPKPVIERHVEPGPTRARRGSVRWSLRDEGSSRAAPHA